MVEANINPSANPSSQFFEPNERMFCIIGNITYDKLRNLTVKKVATHEDGRYILDADGNKTYTQVKVFKETEAGDINEARTDMEDVKIGVMTCFGAKEHEITMIENADQSKLNKTFYAIMAKVYENNEQGKKTFIFLYYAGHGEMDLFTYAMLNADTDDKYRFALEQQLRTLGRIEGAYVIAVFDCCRSHVHPALRRGNAG